MLSIALHKQTPARSLSRSLGRARSYNKVCHVTESRAIASRYSQVYDMGGELPYSQTSRLNHTIDYLITLTYTYSSPITQSGARAGSIIQQSVPKRSLEQSHRDALSCAHIRATWCIKDRQPDHN